MMSSNPALEQTINKVLSQKEIDLITQIDSAYQQSLINLESSRTKLEHEYQQNFRRCKKTSRKPQKTDYWFKSDWLPETSNL